MLAVLGLTVSLFAQQERMAVEGSIQLDDATVPQTAVIRALRPDGSVARNIAPYSTNPSRFGVRFRASDGFLPGDSISFRVVLSARDSFPARIAGPTLSYYPSTPQDVSVNRILLFRNHLPTIRRSVPDTLIDEREFFRFKITAQDADGDPLVYRLVSSAPGARIDHRNGYITWTPDYHQAGQYDFVVGVADGMGESFSRAGRVTVRNVNRPPRIVSQPSDLVVSEGEVVTIQINAAEEDGDSLRFYLLERDYKTSLYSPNGVFAWPLDYSSAGSYEFVAVVSDGEASDTTLPFRVLVQNTNRRPEFATVLFDTVGAEGVELRHPFHATDADGDPVTYRIELAPDGVELGDDGLLTWTPAYDQAGSYVLIVSGSDGTSSSESVARVTVLNRNRRPTFGERHIMPDDRDRTFYEGALVDLHWPAALDPDPDDTLRYTLRIMGRDVDTSFTSLSDTSLGLLSDRIFKGGREFRWLVSVSDGYETTVLDDTSSFRLIPPPPVLTEEQPIGDVSFSFALARGGARSSGSVTSIRYSLAERSDIVLAVYTMLGERIVTLEEGEKDSGVYEAIFDAASLPGGIYMFKLEAHPLEGNRLRDFVSTRRMVLVK